MNEAEFENEFMNLPNYWDKKQTNKHITLSCSQKQVISSLTPSSLYNPTWLL